MRFLPLSLTVLAVLGSLSGAPSAQKVDLRATGGPKLPDTVRVRSLLQQYDFAYKRWRKSIGEAQDEHARKILEAQDPTPRFIPAFEELASEGIGQAKLFLLEHLPAAGLTEEKTKERRTTLLEEICLNHPNEAWTTELQEHVFDLWYTCDQDRVASALLAFVYQTTNKDARRGVGSELASRLGFSGRGPADVATAKSLFEDLLQEDPADGFRQSVRGKIFRLDNMQIGKVVPELKGANVDGEEVRLSDHRGRVVVLDFWGFW